MQGFKSFADPVTIELNEGVTCIIGPNGSGKSNISDALRWVLGEQSSRQLRDCLLNITKLQSQDACSAPERANTL